MTFLKSQTFSTLDSMPLNRRCALSSGSVSCYVLCRCLANYEKANKDLDLARARNKDVALAENK